MLLFSPGFKLLSSGLSWKSGGERLLQLVIGAGLLDSHRETCRALSQESCEFSFLHEKKVWGRIPESHIDWKWLRERD